MTRRYWDANAFLGLLAEEEDKVDLCRAVVRSAERGETQIITSALTIAEVLWVKGEPRVPEEKAQLVEAFFQHEFIVVNDLDRHLAEQARRVVWDHNVKPKDAIHVATALDAGVERLETFDIPLTKRSGQIGTPPLTIELPNEPSQLF